MNTTQQLLAVGQSVWYDNIQRALLNNGEMAQMIQLGEIRGVTSNPTIFMNAITKSHDYDNELASLTRAGASPTDIFWQLVLDDVRKAADLFRPLYEESRRGDGYVSIEVSPHLAQDAEGTLAAARWLWQSVDRPNLMVKIPATEAGLPAISAATAEGININITLIFSNQRYAKVMEAYLEGLEKRLAAGQSVDTIASVASFFVSRVDTKVDGHLTEISSRGGAAAAEATALLGKAAIANARLAYADFEEVFGSARFAALQAQGARVQRPLWASTSTKNPKYRDVRYIEELIGPNTINTVPPATLVAFLDHGVVRPNSVKEGVAEAHQTLAAIEALGISMDTVTSELEHEGVQTFADAIGALLGAIEARGKALLEAGQ